MILVDWRGLLRATDGYQAQPAVSSESLAAYERWLTVHLPLDVKKLYLTSDGVLEQNGQRFVLWPLAESIRRNEREWEAGGSARRELLAIGDDGTGARICVPRDGSSGVFLWDPLTATPHWLANDLGDFWIGWTTRVITTNIEAA
jgi:hypothetical protein